MIPRWQKCYSPFKSPKRGLDRVHSPPSSCWLSLHVAFHFSPRLGPPCSPLSWQTLGAAPSIGWGARHGSSWWPKCQLSWPSVQEGSRATGPPGWMSSWNMSFLGSQRAVLAFKALNAVQFGPAPCCSRKIDFNESPSRARSLRLLWTCSLACRSALLWFSLLDRCALTSAWCLVSGNVAWQADPGASLLAFHRVGAFSCPSCPCLFWQNRHRVGLCCLNEV